MRDNLLALIILGIRASPPGDLSSSGLKLGVSGIYTKTVSEEEDRTLLSDCASTLTTRAHLVLSWIAA